MMQAQSYPVAADVGIPSTHWDGSLAADVFAPCGTPALAVFDGEAWAHTFPLGGYTVTVTAADGTAAYYAHLQAPGKSGPVKAGEVIGHVGDSGNAKGTGCHLHFAVGAIDDNGAGTIAPADWLAGRKGTPGAAVGAGGLVLGGLALLALYILVS